MSKAADRLIVFYYAAIEDTGAPALDPIDSRGTVYAEKCSDEECGFIHRHFSSEKKTYVCGHCGKPWKSEERMIFKGEIKTSKRPGGSEHRLSKRIDVGTQFSEFTTDPKFRWEARLYVANCLGFSIRHLCEVGRKTWGQGFPSWSFRQVRDAVERGRDEWSRRMRLIGLID